MKKLFLFNILFVLSLVCWAQEKQEATKSGPVIAFTTVKYDFGDIKEGDKVEHTFKFENNGNEPLILSNVLPTCGCTIPEWPREPIAPGKSSEIKVVFNSARKSGKQNKVVRVLSNATEPEVRITLIGNVLKKESGSEGK